MRTGTTLAGWFPAYDTSYAKYSPGLIHHLAMAEKAAEAGIQIIDMGRGEKEYKEKLKNGEYEVAEGRIARPTAGAGCTGCSGCRPARRGERSCPTRP
ncbi:GNAT family N-acetyltransferase [Streptosporangium lutulentum]